MIKVTNKKEMVILLSGGAVALFLLIPIFYSIPAWTKFVSLLVAAYVIYLTLRLAWIAMDPTNTSISLKRRATMAQQQQLCWLCGENHYEHLTLTIGFRRPTPKALRFSLVDTALIGEGLADDIQLRVPICESCARRYTILSKIGFFAPLGLDRSFRVLRRKPGYLRGLRHPFEPSNIQIAH